MENTTGDEFEFFNTERHAPCAPPFLQMFFHRPCREDLFHWCINHARNAESLTFRNIVYSWHCIADMGRQFRQGLIA